MSLTHKLKSAGIWQLFQVIFQVMIQFCYMAIMARLLSKEDFGLMAIATGFMGLGMVFSTGGMGSALIQREYITQKHIESAFQGSLLLGLVVCIILFVCSSFIAEAYNEPRLDLIIKAIGCIVFFNSISSVSISLLQKSFKFKVTANITVFITLVSYALGVFLAFINYGVWSLVLSVFLVALLTALVSLYYEPVRLSFSFHYKEFKQLFYYGFGVTLLGLINYLSSGGLNLILGKILPPTMLGVFERTYVIKALPSEYLGRLVNTIMFPAMSEMQSDEDKLFNIYQYSLGIINSILIPVSLFLSFFSKEIVLILLGDKWLEAVIPLQIMFISLPFNSSASLADSVARAKGYVYRNALRKFIFTIVLIPSVAISAKYYGLLGAAIAVTVSYIFNYFIMLFLVESIFRKGIIRTFFYPTFASYKFTLIVCLLVLIPTVFLDNWSHNSLNNFLISSVFIGGCLIIIVWRFPVLLGYYLHGMMKRVLFKN